MRIVGLSLLFLTLYCLLNSFLPSFSSHNQAAFPSLQKAEKMVFCFIFFFNETVVNMCCCHSTFLKTVSFEFSEFGIAKLVKLQSRKLCKDRVSVNGQYTISQLKAI